MRPVLGLLLAIRGFACVLSGTVAEPGGKPIARARVVAAGSGYSLWKATDAAGSFCFEQIEPDSYRVFAEKAGYTTGQRRITIEKDAEPKPVRIEISPIAVISGVVLDADGDPVSGATVALWTRVRGPKGLTANNEETMDTGPDGSFRFTDVEARTYYLSAVLEDHEQRRYGSPFLDAHGGTSREIPRETFYSGALSFGDATQLALKAGQQITNLVLTVRKTSARHIAGRTLVQSPTASLFLSGSPDSYFRGFYVIPIRADDSFSMDGLVPFNYTLQLKEGDKTIAKQRVDLTGGDAEGLVLERLQTVDVAITFRTEGNGPAFHLPQQPVWLVEKDSDEGFPGRPQQDGSLVFRDIVPGVYRWNIPLGGQKLYIRKPGREVDLRGGKAPTIEVVLSPHVARVEGRVSDATEETSIILVSGTASIENRATGDAKGEFKLEGIAPGKYRLFAIQGFDDEQWGSPELAAALAAKGVEVELKEDESRSVTLMAISSDEWEAAVAKVDR